MKILTTSIDAVINSIFLLGETNFEYASENLVPLIGNLPIQRELQNPKFYDRLAEDMSKGCIIPPITIAIIDEINELKTKNKEDLQEYVIENINSFFILDGMQRLNTLDRVVKSGKSYDTKNPLYVNILICPSMDHLLYRMITLNNGQKPMTARHQIEVIASNLYDFDNIGIPNQTEKRKPGEKRKRGAFKKADLIKAYLAFLSESINIDNEKIIQEKMDELIATKILSIDILETSLEFDDVINKIEQLISTPEGKEWFLNQNNIIGFCAGIKKSNEKIFETTTEEFKKAIANFESAFNSLSVSKIKLGVARRKASSLFTEKYESMSKMDATEILDIVSMEV